MTTKAVLIEKTSKRWKFMQIIGGIVAVLGGVAISVGPGGWYVLGLGVFVYLVGRFGAWWCHG